MKVDESHAVATDLADREPLELLFDPRSVVIVGASNDRTKIGGRLLAHLLRYGYAGRLHVVNRTDGTVQGIEAVQAIEDLESGDVDLALIAVPAVHVPASIRSLAAIGVRAAVIVSSGFGEVEDSGAALEQEVLEAARSTGMRILGPNCQGVANVESGLAASFSSVFGTPDGVNDGSTAVVSQSGAMAAVLTQLALGHVDGVRYWAATGNEIDLTVADLVGQVVTDPDIRVVQIYLENLNAAPTLAHAARVAIRRGASLLVLKSGTSADGAKAASSHTGALAQEDSIVDAFFARHGIVRAHNPREMSELGRIFASAKRPAGARVAMITNSGGLGVLLADETAANGLTMAEFAPSTRDTLARVLPVFAATSNPIDVTAQLLSRPELIREAIKAVEVDEGVDIVVVALGILGSYYDLDQILSDVVDLDRRTDKLVVVCWVGGDQTMPARFAAEGIPTYEDTSAVMNALGALVAHEQFVDEPSTLHDLTRTDLQAATLPDTDGAALSEYTGKQIARTWGLSVVDGALAATAEDAVTAAEQMGFPVVLKLSAPGLAHKSELGLVEVGIRDAATLRASAQRMLDTAPTAVTGAVDGLLIERMVPNGMEMSVGLVHDPAIGPVVMIGAGGTATEVLADVQLLVPPLSPTSVRQALERLRMYPLLRGFRGGPTRDIDAFVNLVVNLSEAHAVRGGLVESLDINPVLVLPSGEGAIAVDVALTPRTPTDPEDLA